MVIFLSFLLCPYIVIYGCWVFAMHPFQICICAQWKFIEIIKFLGRKIFFHNIIIICHNEQVFFPLEQGDLNDSMVNANGGGTSMHIKIIWAILDDPSASTFLLPFAQRQWVILLLCRGQYNAVALSECTDLREGGGVVPGLILRAEFKRFALVPHSRGTLSAWRKCLHRRVDHGWSLCVGRCAEELSGLQPWSVSLDMWYWNTMYFVSNTSLCEKFLR